MSRASKFCYCVLAFAKIIYYHLKFLICCFYVCQLPVEFPKLRKTKTYGLQWGDRLHGLCIDDDKLYCVEERREESRGRYSLCVYDIGPTTGTPRILDSLDLAGVPQEPRVCRDTHLVYVPCWGRGVSIVRCDDHHLVTVKTLRCIKKVESVAVSSEDTLFACNDAKSVYAVNVTTDSVIREIVTPEHVGGGPRHVVVLGDTLLVGYGRNTLVMFRNDGTTNGQVVPTPKGLGSVRSLTTDGHTSFLVTGWDSVFVLDDRLLCHRIQHSMGLRDCAVIQSQLWLGYWNTGTITVMTSN